MYGFSYPTPFVATADQDIDSVYHFVKAIDEQYDQYKDKTIMLSEYILDNVLTEPFSSIFSLRGSKTCY